MKKTGYLTAAGVQVGKDSYTMYLEIDKVRIDCPTDSLVTVEVEDKK